MVEAEAGALEMVARRYLLAVVNHAPGRWPLDAHNQFEESTLASAIGTYDAVDLVSGTAIVRPLTARTPP